MPSTPSRFLKITLYFLLFLLLVLPVLYFIFLAPQIRQAQTRQAAQVSSAIESLDIFLDLSQTTFALLGDQLSDSPVPLNPGYIQDKLDKFISTWRNTALVEAVFVDNKGRLLVVSNDPEYRSLPSIDVSDREYFIWSQTARPGEIYLGLPILTRAGAFRGQYIVPVATPIFRNGQFVGTLGMAISVNNLAKSFLDPFKLTDSSRIYLIDTRGVLLYSPFPELQGIDYLEYLDEHPFPGSQFVRKELEKRAQSLESGTLQVILPNAETKFLSLMIIAHQPIVSESGHWLLAMATPLGPTLKLTAFPYIKQLLAVLILIFTFLLFHHFSAPKRKKGRKGARNN